MPDSEMGVPAVAALDAADTLAALRDEFILPEGQIYLDGNSLGPLSKAARERARQIVEQQWGRDLIASWNKHGWIDLPVKVGDKIAPLIGAAPGRVVCCDSISVNLFKLLGLALMQQDGRRIILSQQDNFPTDLYIAQGLETLLGPRRCQLRTVAEADLTAALNDDVAVLLLSQVNFRNGRLHDIAALTEAAHARGIIVIWDLAHSAGVVPLALDDWQVDFAVGCGYKFLNGGPGAPAFVYANDRFEGQHDQPVKGWMGHQAPFDFSPDYEPAESSRSFLAGTPPVLSMAVLDAALDLFDGVSISELRQKSLGLSGLFIDLVNGQPALDALQLQTPEQEDLRGSQLAFAHPQAYGICQALAARGVIADFRSPDLLRFGFSPMLLSYVEIARSVEALKEVVESESFLAPEFNQRQKVT